jgi:hypothetical protein
LNSIDVLLLFSIRFIWNILLCHAFNNFPDMIPEADHLKRHYETIHRIHL